MCLYFSLPDTLVVLGYVTMCGSCMSIYICVPMIHGATIFFRFAKRLIDIALRERRRIGTNFIFSVLRIGHSGRLTFSPAECYL